MSKISLMVSRFPNSDRAKVGLPLDQDGLADLASVQPTVIKILNNYDDAAWLKATHPDVMVIVRYMPLEEAFEGQVQKGVTDPAAAAALWLKTFKAAINAAGPGVYWEVAWNEPDPTDLPWLNQFYVAVQNLAAAHVYPDGTKGVHLCILNPSAEFGLGDKVGQFAAALSLAAKLGNVLGMHGYDSPVLNDPTSPFLFPHRRIPKSLVASNDFPYVVYTEFGIDTILSLNKHYDGWKTTGTNAQGYTNQLIWADGELSKDAVVIGATVYIYTRDADDGDKTFYNVAFASSSRKDADPPVWDLLYPWMAAHPAPLLKGGVVAPIVGTTPPPVTPTSGPTKVKLAYGCNQRSAPSINGTLLGYIGAGAFQTVAYPSINGYCQVAGQDYWLLASNLKPV